MKRALLYISLWLEILSATCRWAAVRKPAKWRSFVTVALVQTGFLSPPRNKPRQIFQAAQRESIQRCLRVNPRVLNIIRNSENRDEQNLETEGKE